MNNFKITVGGVPSSGSTAVWQAVCQMFHRKITKHHGYFGPPDGVLVLCIRDFRDILASLVRREIFGDCVDVNSYALQCWSYLKDTIDGTVRYLGHPGTLIVRYEGWARDEEKLIRFLLSSLRMQGKEEAIINITSLITLEANKKRASAFRDHSEYDRLTNIHGKHITSDGAVGAWQDLFDKLDPKVRERIQKEMYPYLKKFEYVE